MVVRTKLFLAAFLIVSGMAIVLNHSRIAAAIAPGPICGNFVIEETEQCDDGNTNPGDGCSLTCQIEVPPSACGNGAVEANEICDDGNIVTEDCNYGETSCTVCDETCQSVPGYTSYCGDNALSGEEQCDDGNIVDGDGCSAACTMESATPVCGNGIVETSETCDDGNIIPGDGCSCYCQTEQCGDGKQDANEQCDDGNIAAGDGCSDTCNVEKCQKSSKTCVEKKITICHMPPGNKSNVQIISVGVSALSAHLAHGDTLGDCNNTCR